jgi:BrnA antitoxin of type II toxin-antitoxin system
MIGARRRCASISIYLDRDIVEHFKKQATTLRTDAYQTQINRVLRAAIEGSIADQHDIDTFADLIAEKVAARISKTKASSAARGKVLRLPLAHSEAIKGKQSKGGSNLRARFEIKETYENTSLSLFVSPEVLIY